MKMSKEIKDIAMWEETDSELAKYKIQALNSLVNSYKRQNEFLEASIKHIEQVNTDLYKRIDKATEYIKTFIEIDEETGTYSMPYTFDAANLYHLLKILKGVDNE